MKILVIPDVHLKPWLFNMAENILNEGKADKALCLMDIPDDWNKELQISVYKDTFDRVICFAKAHPDTLWCYGNHEVSYLKGRLETGYSPYAERTVLTGLEELKQALPDQSQLAIMHRVDNVLFSHGGLSAEFVKRLGLNPYKADADDVIDAVNNAPENYLWTDESPLWLRPKYRNVEAFREEIYTQVIGHTPEEYISRKGAFISTDMFSTYRTGEQIGESAMIVIDSVTCEYEKIYGR